MPKEKKEENEIKRGNRKWQTKCKKRKSASQISE